jgi:hypothetical protein
MTKGRNTLPSRRLCYPILGALANEQITVIKLPLLLVPTLDAFKKTKTPDTSREALTGASSLSSSGS